MKENEQKTLLRSSDDLIAAVEQYGFLPFFRNEIHGFSIEELCPPELWRDYIFYSSNIISFKICIP
jgi:hypothetical protein